MSWEAFPSALSNFPMNFSLASLLNPPFSPVKHDDGGEMYYRNPPRDANRDVSRRKASINELSEEEIVLAYQQVQATRKSSCDSSETLRDEFQRWLEMKKSTSSDEQPKCAEKVKTIDDAEIPVDVVDVVEGDETMHSEDFDEFRDVISDNEEGGDEEYLKVPLVILEDEQAMMPSVIESDIPTEKSESPEPNTVEAKITLTNAPLEVVTSLSSSNFSLASDQSGDDTASVKKRPANHSKGRAPPPPTTPNVMPGFYFDHVTQKLFKETEL
jgi:glutaredoxin-related protein